MRVAVLVLLAFPVIAKASEQDLASTGRDEGPLVQGQDEEVLMDESTDGRGDFEGLPADGVDPIQILRDLAESGEKDFGGRTQMEASKRKWSNNEYLRVWGKRNAFGKLSRQDSTRDPSQREILRKGPRPGKDPVLVLLGLRPSDVRGSASLAQLEGVARESGAGFRVLDGRDFGPRFLGMGTGIPRPEEARPKRKWERNSLRIWGKRGEAVNPGNPGSLNDRLMYTNMRRRKWENLPLRVWGK